MKCVEIMITNASGLHARPASELADICKQFSSDITIYNDGRIINPKSAINILAGCIEPGSLIRVQVDGTDEALCIERIEAFIIGLKD